MKILLAIIAIMGIVIGSARAQSTGTDVVINTNTNSIDITTGTTTTPFGRGILGTFRDVKNGEWLVGGITSVYDIPGTLGYGVLDLGVASPASDSGKISVLSGAEVLAGKVAYDHVPAVKTICDNISIASFLVKNFRIGGYAGYDINYNKTRYGYYLGYHIALGSSSTASTVALKK